MAEKKFKLIEGAEYIFRLLNPKQNPSSGELLNDQGEPVFTTSLDFDDVLHGTIVEHVALLDFKAESECAKTVAGHPVTHAVVIKVTVPFARTTRLVLYHHFVLNDMPQQHDVIKVYFTDQGTSTIVRVPRRDS